jgi:hypothetical protein
MPAVNIKVGSGRVGSGAMVFYIFGVLCNLNATFTMCNFLCRCAGLEHQGNIARLSV